MPDEDAAFAHAREIGHILKRARVELGMSQEHVAYSAGLSAYTYQKFEKGESRPGVPMNPKMRTILALCQVLHLTVEEFITPNPPDFSTGR